MTLSLEDPDSPHVVGDGNPLRRNPVDGISVLRALGANYFCIMSPFVPTLVCKSRYLQPPAKVQFPGGEPTL